jgi:hypothetical protein
MIGTENNIFQKTEMSAGGGGVPSKRQLSFRRDTIRWINWLMKEDIRSYDSPVIVTVIL